MKKILVVTFIICVSNLLFSQQAYFNIGRNFTNYDFTNSEGNGNENINGSSGVAYEIGYAFDIGYKWTISTGITLNEFNATGGDLTNNYSWNTNYIGAQGMLRYKILGGRRTNFNLNLNGGLNLNHIVSGTQKINGQVFELACQKEFKGIFLQPILGLDAKYFITRELALGMGYHLSKNYGLTNNSPQKLNFNNSQLQFGILMSLN